MSAENRAMTDMENMAAKFRKTKPVGNPIHNHHPTPSRSTNPKQQAPIPDTSQI